MLTKFLFLYFSLIHDKEINKLSTVIILLSIALIAILALLTLNLIKAHKLKAENKKLKGK